ncbi:MAG TPA: hypothetical protein VI296_01965 [Candidatus Dormibacteraeota bacterium]
MPRLTALTNGALCCMAVVGIAACGAVQPSSSASTTVPVNSATGGSTGVTSAATQPAIPMATPDTSGINQQISGIDSQLSTIDGQLNAAKAGLSNSEGDPSQ